MDFKIKVHWTTTNGIMSRLIRWVTKSKTSHSFVSIQVPETNLRLALTAEGEGFSAVPLQRYLKSNKLIYEAELIGLPADESVVWLMEKYLGTDYDTGAAALVTIREKFSFLWKKCKGFFRKILGDSGKVMCSESVIEMLQHAGYATVKEMVAEDTNAERLYQAALKHPEEFKFKQI